MEISRAKENPGDADPVKRQRPGDPSHVRLNAVNLFRLVRPFAMDHQRDTMERTPNDKRPCAAVPQAAQDHRDHDISIHEPARAAVPPQRNVKIIAQPTREADVPAMPEVANIMRGVGKSKIDREFVAEEPRAGDGHVRVSREVAINLDRIKENADPGARSSKIPWRIEVAVDHGRDSVGDAGFFDEAGEKKNERAANIDIRKFPRHLELW